MDQSATQRLPVELWSTILHFAVASPLLPFTHHTRETLQTGIVECLDLFDVNCDAYSTYRSNQTNLTNLRLVCHSWDLVLRGHYGLFSATNLKRRAGMVKAMEDPTVVERLQIDKYMPDHKCSNCKRRSSYTLTGSKTCSVFKHPQETNLNSPGELQNVLKNTLHSGIKTIAAIVGVEELTRILLSVPNLLALSFELNIGLNWSQTKSQTLDRLTHLEILNIACDLLILLPTSIRFEKLQYLSLQFWFSGQNSLHDHSIGKWSLPNLKSLALDGVVEPHFHEDIRSLLRGCAPTLTQLCLSITNEDEEIEHLGDIWKLCPKLDLYGCMMAEITAQTIQQYPRQPHPEGSPHITPITLLLTDLFIPLDDPWVSASLVISLDLFD
ncbi:7055_t:CDS:1, partial [Acaulospora colombiana]